MSRSRTTRRRSGRRRTSQQRAGSTVRSSAPSGGLVSCCRSATGSRSQRAVSASFRRTTLLTKGAPVAQVDHIVDGIYRISTPPDPEVPITFNQFLIEDEAPVLVHTGVHQAYDGIHKAIKEVLDPASLAYVVLLHFEGDECGGMDRFMAEAKNAQLVGSNMSAILNLTT